MATTQQDLLVDRFVRFTETGEDSDGILAEDVFADLNVPQWRFQLQGREALSEWVKAQLGLGTTTAVERVFRGPDGFVVDAHCDIRVPDGEVYCRVMYLVETRAGQVSELVMYCTGGWDAETRKRQAAEAPMIRPLG